MSWDHNSYAANCVNCGHTGFKIQSTDDWGSGKVSWIGFIPYIDFPNHEYLVARKKIDVNEYAKCPKCGSTNIEVGSQIVKHE